MVRINLSVPDHTPERLSHLAGSERKRGAWIAKIVDAQFEQGNIPSSDDLMSLRFQLIGVMARLTATENELSELKRELGK